MGIEYAQIIQRQGGNECSRKILLWLLGSQPFGYRNPGKEDGMEMPDLFAQKMVEAKAKSDGRGVTDADVLPHAYRLAWNLILNRIMGFFQRKAESYREKEIDFHRLGAKRW